MIGPYLGIVVGAAWMLFTNGLDARGAEFEAACLVMSVGRLCEIALEFIWEGRP